jgi:hypothetical protein
MHTEGFSRRPNSNLQVEEQIRLMGVTYRQKLDDMAQLSQSEDGA